jgi:4,5-DOPA dioxygenase extradiol
MEGMAERLPSIFFGHGNPMNALQRNRYTEAWSAAGREIPKPKAVLCISAHWYISGSALTVNTAPETIHDFGGFPPALHRVQYPAPGDPALARRVQQLLSPLPVDLSLNWGLDHGAWSVLKHIYPEADVPVVQLGIDRRQAPAFHYEVGQRLAPLREDGVLIMGSGNLVHNLRAMRWGAEPAPAYDWADRFERLASKLMLGGQHAELVNYDKLGADATLSIPTPEHYLPLLYVLGTALPQDPITFPVTGVDLGSISMLAARIG